VEDRAVPGHWEGDLFNGAGNRSAVGTLVERTSRLILLVKVKNATAEAAPKAFREAFARVSEPLRQTLAYDQGKEMACHKALAEATGLKILLADPRSPWPRASNENSNGLIRQFLPKGANLNLFQEDDLEMFGSSSTPGPAPCMAVGPPGSLYRCRQRGSCVVARSGRLIRCTWSLRSPRNFICFI
jgi:IS30 family transposase